MTQLLLLVAVAVAKGIRGQQELVVALVAEAGVVQVAAVRLLKGTLAVLLAMVLLVVLHQAVEPAMRLAVAVLVQ